jgi:hypothetical protein
MKTPPKQSDAPGVGSSELVRQWHLQRFATTGYELLPRLAFGHEPGIWEYPPVTWLAWAWLRWHWQLSLYHESRVPNTQAHPPADNLKGPNETKS